MRQKTLTFIAVGVCGLLLSFALVVMKLSVATILQPFSATCPGPTVARTDAASVAQGAALVQRFGCAQCHGNKLQGQVLVDETGFGVLASANLTDKSYGMAEYVRALRCGVDRNGLGLWLQPCDKFGTPNDEELAVIGGYLQSLPTQASSLPRKRLTFLGRVKITFGAKELLVVRSAAK